MSVFKKVMIGIGSAVVVIALLIVLAFYVTSGLTKTVYAQLDAVKQGDMVKAYSYTSSSFQNVTSLQDFKQLVSSFPIMANYKEVSIPSRELKDGIGTVKVILTSQADSTVEIDYQLTKENGEWKINYMEIPPAGASIKKDVDSFDSKLLQNNSPKAVPSNDDLLTNSYENSSSRYSIKYPKDWIYTSPDKYSVIFSGQAGSDDYYSTVNIQVVKANVLEKQQKPDVAVNTFLKNLKGQFAGIATDVKYSGNGTFNLTRSNGDNLQGAYFIVSYNLKGDVFKQWQIVIMRNDTPIFYAWAYTAPVKIYDTYLPIAKAMLKSWKVS